MACPVGPPASWGFDVFRCSGDHQVLRTRRGGPASYQINLNLKIDNRDCTIYGNRTDTSSDFHIHLKYMGELYQYKFHRYEINLTASPSEYQVYKKWRIRPVIAQTGDKCICILKWPKISSNFNMATISGPVVEKYQTSSAVLLNDELHWCTEVCTSTCCLQHAMIRCINALLSLLVRVFLLAIQ